MTEVLAVFRSRSQALDCNMRLRARGVPSNLINTPKEANIGCGLSVKFAVNMLFRAKPLILSGGYTAFFGFYSMNSVYGRTVIKRM